MMMSGYLRSGMNHSFSSHYGNNNNNQYNYSEWEGNSSITTSVTIHVTPTHIHLTSWAYLWAGFLLAIIFASYQVWLEHKNFKARNNLVDDGGRSSSNVGGGGSGGGSPSNNVVVDGEQTAISSSDLTRSRFRRLLLLAMITRAVMIPIQIWSNPLWAQFVADTLPEMAFASAWCLLVSFFVQLVGIASGTGNTTSTGMVIQMTAYVVYGILIGTYIWNPLASVLLYALLCCIYAALLGTTLFFCPRLLSLLKPSLERHSGLGIRLLACTAVCIFVFGARTFGFARKVVAPPSQVMWWWQYGVLELIPTLLFLIMMHPNSKNLSSHSSNSGSSSVGVGGGGGSSFTTMMRRNNSNSQSTSPANVTPPSHYGGKPTEIPLPASGQHRRQGSHGSGAGGNYSGKRSSGAVAGGAVTGVGVGIGAASETAPLIKPHNVSAYGATTAAMTASAQRENH